MVCGSEIGQEANTWILLLLSTGVTLSVHHVTDSPLMCTEGNAVEVPTVLDLRTK
jgi:hypothetical protein